MTKVNERNNFSREKQIYLWVIDRGRHWDPSPNPKFWDWDWDWDRFLRTSSFADPWS